MLYIYKTVVNVLRMANLNFSNSDQNPAPKILLSRVLKRIRILPRSEIKIATTKNFNF